MPRYRERLTRNQDVANLLYEIGELLEVQGVAFKPRAYQRAARNIEAMGEDVEALAREDRLDQVPGVGEAIEEKIKEFLSTDRLAYLEKLRKEVPEGVRVLMAVPGIGPKRAVLLNKELKISTLSQLEAAAKGGRIRGIPGFGEQWERQILGALQQVRAQGSRVPYVTALQLARDLVAHLETTGGAQRIEPAGSLRRGRDTVGDLDLLAIASANRAASVLQAFQNYPKVTKVIESGSTRSRVLLSGGFQVDLRVIPPSSFGAALQYFTGSKEHSIALRTLARKKGWTINEYALSQIKTGKRIAGTTEEEIYHALGLEWIPPELRENRGEIEAAAKKKLPRLVESSDLKGDLHTHTTESDGTNTAAQMLEEARKIGHAWVGVSDHAEGMGIVHGLDGPRYARQRKELAKLQERFPKLRIMQGSEIDVRKDGSLHLDAKARAALDYTIGSVHSHFALPRKEQTARVLRAVESGIDLLGHPTGRKIAERPEIDVDWNRVFERAADSGVLLEINASPERLDLAGERVRAAREHKVRFVVNSDAHSVFGLHFLEYGLTQARRGGLEASQCVSSFSANQLERHLGHSKRP